jgi:CheY-like chemotaxis protein
MISDLVSLKALLVFPSIADRDLLRQGADLASVPIEVLEAGTAAAAQSHLIQGGIDLVLLDANLSKAEKDVISKSARATKERPFVIVFGADRDGSGLDGSIGKPATVDEARSTIERCIRKRIPARVLIVDDSATMRGIVRKILSASKFPLEVAEVDEGVKALHELRHGAFDIVFLDYNMPGLNGLETLSELRREHPRVIAVLMTSTEDENFADRARRAGAAAFLKKPFFPADIDAVLYRFYKLDAPPPKG